MDADRPRVVWAASVSVWIAKDSDHEDAKMAKDAKHEAHEGSRRGECLRGLRAS